MVTVSKQSMMKYFMIKLFPITVLFLLITVIAVVVYVIRKQKQDRLKNNMQAQYAVELSGYELYVDGKYFDKSSIADYDLFFSQLSFQSIDNTRHIAYFKHKF